MIRSMTGYGQGEVSQNDKRIAVEIKSVNHKYLDVNIKMPRRLIKFEGELRNILKEYAGRGKVDIFITFEDHSEGSNILKYDAALARQYFENYKKIGEDLGIEEETRISSIARSPEVLTLEESEIDDTEVLEILEKAARLAFAAFESAREKEGNVLKADIQTKLEDMSVIVGHIENKLPEIIAEYKQKLEARVKELLGDSNIDDNRIAAEVVLYADKVAIDEELVRLKSHINSMKDVLTSEGEKGRNMDFLAQEMNRESNTILSKSNDVDITNMGIELKTCIEKIREQVQNIE